MRALWSLACGLALLVLLPVNGSAQSLGEVAAKERAKKKDKSSAKVYTEDDLRKAGTSGTYTPSGAAQAPSDTSRTAAQPASGEGGGEGSSPRAGGEGSDAEGGSKAAEQKAAQEKAWRLKKEAAQKELDRISAEVAKLQALLPSFNAHPARADYEARLAAAKKAQSDAQAMISQLDDEGRRNSWR
jgi:hypothetical protein